ncbi:MAG: DNA-binding protein WhiA [Clostridia bacterium]|nr:DNA-binding protein WhiA [Clostridia bacterium]
MSETFRTEVQNEIVDSLPKDRDSLVAFLSGLTKATGTIEIANKRMNLCLQLDGFDEGMKIVEAFKELYPTEFELSLSTAKSGAKAGKQICSLQVPYGFSKQILADFGLMTLDGEDLSGFIEGVPFELLKKEECKRAFLAGLFLGCGSVYVPSLAGDEEKRDGYHLELQFDDENYAEDVVKLFDFFALSAKTSDRGDHKLVYFKDKDEIAKVLVLFGLSECVLKLQTIINERETANSLNRAIICETANMDKTFAAASKHLLAIGKIYNFGLFEALTPALKETAQARMDNPESSLQDLADALGVSKSCLNHRLRKLVEISEELPDSEQ